MAIAGALRASGMWLGALVWVALTPVGARLGGMVTDKALMAIVRRQGA